MRLILLGTAGYHPNDRRHTACVLLPECGLMFDAGTAVFRAAEYLALPELDIFLTHAQLDHVVGLTFMHDVARAHPLRRVAVHARPDNLRAIEEHLFAAGLFPTPPPFECRPLEAEYALSDGGRLTHFPLEHRGGSIGYRIDWAERSMAYVTDTTADPAAAYVEKLKGVDLLLHECYFSDDHADWARKVGHSHTSKVAEVARRAGAGVLVLVHINPLATADDPIGLDAAKAIFPNTILGEDRMELEF